MKRVLLIHFSPEQAHDRLLQLRTLGFEAEYAEIKGYRSLAKWRASPPDAIVIDLSIRPSHGRALAATFRTYATTRLVPIVFVEGDAAKTAKIREAFPDAAYTSWAYVGKALNAAQLLTSVPKTSTGLGYSGSPLPKKMNIKPGSRVLTLGAPEDFEQTLGALPEGAELVRSGVADLIVLFATSQADLEGRFTRALRHTGKTTRLSLVWPKKTADVASDLNGNLVREFGLSMGWVDFKVFAIDPIWSGLLFAPQKRTPER